MKRLVVKYELLNLRREKLLLLLFAASSLFAVLAFYNGYRFSQNQALAVTAAQQEQQTANNTIRQGLAERQARQGPLNWWDDKHDLRGQAFYLMVNYATKAPLPTAAIAVGQADIQPYFFRMLVTEKQHVLHQYDYTHPLALLLGQLDLAFVIIYLLPLLLIGACFNALSEEKQSGQLRIMMLQGISPATLVAAQILVRAGAVMVPFLLISNLCLWLFSPGITFISLLIFSLLVLLYTGFWLALTAWVISLGKNAANNAARLVTAWLGLVIIVPAVLNILIMTLNPSPSRLVYVDQMRSHTDKVNQQAAQTLANFFQDHPELAKTGTATNDYATSKIAKILAVEQAMQPFDDAFVKVLHKQNQQAGWLKHLSPATLLHAALIDLAGNGQLRHQAFMQEVQQHHQKLQTYFASRIALAAQNGDFAPCSGCNARVTLADASDIPVFSSQASLLPIPYGAMLMLVLLIVLLTFASTKALSKMHQAQSQTVLV
ncbi:DUF3526 domain-containing protein [Bowmanella denitrificans]|uniref:DUF3526 domain-containing protein n=1 Tax=Bowmanella denitrificans TaxID=366582 RepID=UPI000C9BE117|nr:DUF3526 domain-containing protein [Bowmanella denitrificans]